VTAAPLTAADVLALRQQFPGLHQRVHGRELVYLDNAATAQVPQRVVDALVRATTLDRANVHRGVHELSQRASAGFERARAQVAAFVGAADPREIVFVRGATEGINLLAATLGASVGPGDEIVVTAMEHHSNLVPWQMLASRVGATVRAIPHDDRGVLDLDAARGLIGPRCKIVAMVHVSNSLGTINPVSEVVALAREVGARVVLDAAQSAPHAPLDARALGVDALVFSGHKVCGPFGVGAVWAPLPLWESLPPWQGGGGMIADVRLERTLFGAPPMRFEAGTPDVAGAVGLGEACAFLGEIGMDRVAAWEHGLLTHATARLAEVPGLRVLGTAPDKAAVVSFAIDGAAPLDVGMLLDRRGVAIRTGHHCTQPVMDFFGVSAAARASFAFYNTHEEVDAFVDALLAVRAFL
jgi:cysteine desulfurase/selenocysteine lyase